jgi:hypothetical protein
MMSSVEPTLAVQGSPQYQFLPEIGLGNLLSDARHGATREYVTRTESRPGTAKWAKGLGLDLAPFATLAKSYEQRIAHYIDALAVVSDIERPR